MDIKVYDQNFVAIDIIDVTESFIWTDRYCDWGDFEIYTNVTQHLLDVLKEDYYLTIPNSDRVMVIESVNITYTNDVGYRLAVKGRSFESVLDRRIILQQTIIDTTLQLGIKRILDENVISSSQWERNIPGISFVTTADAYIATLTLKAQYDCEGVYDTILYLCQKNNIGFKLVLNSSNVFEFSLYYGKDRSALQTTYPLVIFSPTFDNLVSSDYFHTKQFYKNYTLILAQEIPPNTRPRFPWWVGAQPTGLQRREIYTDAGDLSRYDSGGIQIPDEPDYHEQGRERGRKTLSENSEISTFSAQLALNQSYKYGIDFFLGDVVQFEDEFGHVGQTRITEITFSENLSGFNIYPTFDSV